MNLEVGTLFRWGHFSWPKYSAEKKSRWFIYLGETDSFAQIALVYLATTTTKLEHFQYGGVRASHSHFKFETRQFTIFDKDCIIDFDEKPYAVEKEKLLKNRMDIIVKGKLDEKTLRMIYNRFLHSGVLSKMEMLDIHNSFNKAGITGLAKPK